MNHSIPYKPANATETEGFLTEYCRQCIHDNFDQTTLEGGCPLLAMWLTHPPGHKEYPVQLQLDEKGIGRCTEFQLRPELQRCQHTRDLFPNDDAA